MTIPIISIVEGHGEVHSLPLLLRRLIADIRPDYRVDAPFPIRVPRDKLLKEGQLERYFELATVQAAGGGVLVLVDAEDPDQGCPAALGPRIRKRISLIRNDVPALVVVAKNEYESWFLAAAESLRGKRGLRQNIEAPLDPEGIRGAKEWLRSRMGHDRYSETLDQPALTAAFDLVLARRAPSFDRFYQRFGDFCDQIARRAES